MAEFYSTSICSIHGPAHTDAECPDRWQHDRSPVREKIETPYFIREATLKKTLERLREVEPSKRKIIVYVGVHPNEGTDLLTQKYAAVWAKKYGATVVCQPTEQTPHAIWAKRKKETNGDATIPLPSDTLLDEDYYSDQFSLENNDTFIIQFHGTPLGAYKLGGSQRKPGLDIETSRYARHSEDFQNRKIPITFSKPNITEGLAGVIASSNTENGEIQYKIFEEDYQPTPRWHAPHGPNIMVVEYFYEGKPVTIEDPYIRSVLEQEEKAELKYRTELKKYDKGTEIELEEDMVLPLSKDKWHLQMNIGPSYIAQDTLSAVDVTRFDTTVVQHFEKILEHVYARLPE